MTYEDDRAREQDRKYWDALGRKDYAQAVYHLSPRLYQAYLDAGQVSPEDREALERQMRQTLVGLLVPFAAVDLALWTVSKWFGFGQFRDVSPLSSPERAHELARLDAQKVAIVRALLDDPGLALSDKVEATLRAARIRPDSTMGWGEAMALAEILRPHGYGVQADLEAWAEELRRGFLRSSLGGTW